MEDALCFHILLSSLLIFFSTITTPKSSAEMKKEELQQTLKFGEKIISSFCELYKVIGVAEASHN